MDKDRNRRGATSRRREGQTGLISLQRPLKFLPWDINEVIHRKTAARHTTPPYPPTHLNKSLQLPIPSPPRCSATLPRKGSAVPGKKPHTTSSPEHDSSRSIGPGAGGGWAEGLGGGCAAYSERIQCDCRGTGDTAEGQQAGVKEGTSATEALAAALLICLAVDTDNPRLDRGHEALSGGEIAHFHEDITSHTPPQQQESVAVFCIGLIVCDIRLVNTAMLQS
ncbi:unnamed protein product [Pleuronectes platessa]|uniref:Uncharacterized protein n=1 Tax=Pleuronectes platessa TaxID=8262 RepID=A0A9N7YFL8_PLEPL|nr:unnamed protein product [Pleuronectes platessa]